MSSYYVTRVTDRLLLMRDIVARLHYATSRHHQMNIVIMAAMKNMRAER